MADASLAMLSSKAGGAVTSPGGAVMKSALVSPISQQWKIVGISKSFTRSSSCTISHHQNPPSFCFLGSHSGHLTSLFYPRYGFLSIRSSRSFSLSAASMHEQRLLYLRQLFLKPEINIDAYIIPSHDAHQSEFMAECFMRLAYVSNFTGSAGTAIITKNKAALWTDGRYFLQAEKQLSSSWVLMRSGNSGVPTTSEWINDVLDPGSRIGIDPFLFSSDSAEELEGEIAKKNNQLVYLYDYNLIDEIWGDSRPKSPDGSLRIHELNYAGLDVMSKLTSLRSELLRTGCSALVLSMLDEIAWLLNLRGCDVPHSPVMYAYLIVEISGATLLINKSKVTRATNEHLQQAGIDIMPYESILSEIERLASMGTSLWLDTRSVNAAIVDTYKSAYLKNLNSKGSGNADRNTDSDVQHDPSLFCVTSPVALSKAVKNTAELEGMRHCHLRDAAALVEFLTWLEDEINNGVKLSEVEVGNELIKYRTRQDGFVDTSFETISAFGANASIVHYIPEQSGCAIVDRTNLFLLDSGAQYIDGTTDVTRTVHFGQPTAWQKECFTRVLQGHIAVDQAVFPEDTPGFVLDAFARSFLWKIGLDYRHGTGHGVGAALNVHEGPQSISFRFKNTTSLQRGMVVSNEPGYYEDHSFGIRIENLLFVKEMNTPNHFGGKHYFGFEKLTFVPIQIKMIDMSLISDTEVSWINEYHDQVWAKVSPLVKGDKPYEWLRYNTRPLPQKPPHHQ